MGSDPVQIIFRASVEERERLRAEAKAAGLSQGQYIRSRLFGTSTSPTTMAANYASLDTRMAAVEEAITKGRAVLGAPPVDTSKEDG